MIPSEQDSFFEDEPEAPQYVEDNDPLDIVAQAVEEQDITMEMGEDGYIEMEVFDEDGNPLGPAANLDDEGEEGEETYDDLLEEHTVLEKRWKDLTGWSTKLSQANADLRRSNQELEVRMARLEGKADTLAPGEPTIEEPTLPDIDWSDPQAVHRYVNETADARAEAIVEKRLEPVAPLVDQLNIQNELGEAVHQIPDFMDYWDGIQAYYDKFPTSEISFREAYNLVKAFAPSTANQPKQPSDEPAPQPAPEALVEDVDAPRQRPQTPSRQEMIDRAIRLRTETGVSGTEPGLDRAKVVNSPRDAIEAAAEEVYG